MSYILDALNKSEQERQQREHGVSLQPLTGVPHPGNDGARWLPLAAVAIVVAAIGIFAAVYFTMKAKAPPAPLSLASPTSAPPPAARPLSSTSMATAAAPKPSSPARAQSGAAASAAIAAASSETRPAGSSDTVKSLYQRKGIPAEQAMAQAAAEDARTAAGNAANVKTFAPDETASVQTSEAARESAEPSLPKSTINQKALDAAVAQQREAELAARVQAELERMQAQDAQLAAKAAAIAAARVAKAQPKPQPKAAVPAKPAPVADPDANVPLATQLSSDVQKRIPNIDFGAHVYAGRTNNGFVILNGKKRYMGDSVAPGLVVERITEDGVILDLSGTRFKLNSMSSWIN